MPPERLDVSGVTAEGAAWLASAGAYPRSTLALWRERPEAPVVLLCGSAFDVVSASALFGRRMLDRLWDEGPGSGPVAAYRGRILLFAAPGTAQRLPSLMEWEEWGTAAAGREGTGERGGHPGTGADGTAGGAAAGSGGAGAGGTAGAEVAGTGRAAGGQVTGHGGTTGSTDAGHGGFGGAAGSTDPGCGRFGGTVAGADAGYGGTAGGGGAGYRPRVGRCREVPPLLCHGTGDAVTVPPLSPGAGGPEAVRAESRWLVAPDTRMPWLPGPEILLWAAVRAARAAASAAVRISIFPRADQDAKVYDVSRRR